MTQADRKPGRWKTWALVGSVALNLVMAGMLGGIVLRGGPDGGLMRAAIGAVPGKARHDLRHAGRAAFRGLHRDADMRKARADLLAALRAEPFDAAVFRAGLDAAQSRLLQVGDRMEAALLAQVAAMDHAERRAMADRLEKRTGRFRGPRD